MVVLIERASELLDRLERERTFEVDLSEFATANVTLSELRTAVLLLEEANTIPAFKRVEATITKNKDYSHTLLLVAARAFLEIVGNGAIDYYSTTTSPTPDLRIQGSRKSLFVEVYAPQALQHPPGATITDDVARAIVDRKRKDKRKRRQLDAGESLLLIGGSGCDDATADLLEAAAAESLQKHVRPQLIGIAIYIISAVVVRDGDELGIRRTSRTRIALNPHYVGDVQLAVDAPLPHDMGVVRLVPDSANPGGFLVAPEGADRTDTSE